MAKRPDSSDLNVPGPGDEEPGAIGRAESAEMNENLARFENDDRNTTIGRGGISTRAVHGGERQKGGLKARATLDALTTPIVQTATFTFRNTAEIVAYNEGMSPILPVHSIPELYLSLSEAISRRHLPLFRIRKVWKSDGTLRRRKNYGVGRCRGCFGIIFGHEFSHNYAAGPRGSKRTCCYNHRLLPPDKTVCYYYSPENGGQTYSDRPR